MKTVNKILNGIVSRSSSSFAEKLENAISVISPKLAFERSRFKAAFNFLNDSEGYAVPGAPKRALRGVISTNNSPTVDISHKLRGIRALSRSLFMSSSLAASVLRRRKTRVICTGLRPQLIPDYAYLGISAELAKQFSNAGEREFDLWSESVFSDFSCALNFFELQMLACLALLLDGDFFFMPVWRKPPLKDFPYWLSIKMIPADCVRNPFANIETDLINGGIEKNKSGQVVAYHVWDTYPNDTKIGTCTRISVYNKGYKQIYHVCSPERIGQNRGLPLLASSAENYVQLKRLSEAEMMGAIISSYFTVFVKDQTGINGPFNPYTTDTESVITDSERAEDLPPLEMGYGNITYVGSGKDIVIANPNKTDADYHKFHEAQAIETTASCGMPYEESALHYTTSYTAARAADNLSWLHVSEDRKVLSDQFLTPVISELLFESVIKGRVKADTFFKDYHHNRAWKRSIWIGHGRGSLDPLKEVKASVESVDNLLSTREEQYTAYSGGRYDEMILRRSSEESELKKLGLKQDEKSAEESESENA